MRHFKLIFYLIFFSILFLVVIKLEPELSNKSDDGTSRVNELFKHSEKMRLESNLEFQINEWLSRLVKLAKKDEIRVFNNFNLPEEINKSLPEGDICLVKALVNNGFITKEVTLKGHFDRSLAETFIAFEKFKAAPELGTSERSEYMDLLAKGNTQFCELIGEQTMALDVLVRRSSRMSLFVSDKSYKGFYWDKIRSNKNENIFIFANFNLTNVNEKFPFKSFISLHRDNTSFLNAFYLENKNELVIDFRLRSVLDKGMKEWLKEELSKDRKNFRIISRFGKTFCLGITSEIFKARPLFLINEGDNQLKHSGALKNAILGLLIMLIVFWCVEHFIFNRGPRLKIEGVLILAFLLGILMPFFIARSVYLSVMKENSDTERLKVERQTHSALTSLDTGMQLFHSNIYHRCKTIMKDPKVYKAMLREEKMDFPDADIKDTDIKGAYDLNIQRIGSGTNSYLKNSIVEHITNIAIEPFVLKDFSIEDRSDRTEEWKKRVLLGKINTFLLNGPRDFMRFYDKQKQRTTTKETTGNMQTFALLELHRLALVESIPDSKMHPIFSSGSFSKVKNIKKSIIFSEAEKLLKTVVGQKRVFEMLNNYNSINWFRNSVGYVHFTHFPIYVDKHIRYFAGIGWDELSTDPMYLFRRLRAFDEFYQGKSHSERGAAETERTPMTIQTFSGVLRESIVADPDRFDDSLRKLLNDCSKNRMVIKKTVEENNKEGEPPAYYEVIPGKYLKIFNYGAKQDLTYLVEKVKRQTRLFNFWLIIFILIAVFSSRGISKSFVNPLQHLLWGMKRVDENDLQVKLMANREDEFGALSRAFNMMVGRLREKDTLGKYVSSSILELTKSPELIRDAMKGKEEDVTILFADLQGFKAYQDTNSSEKVEKLLEYSLGLFFKELETSEGEIDKVIGEKVLIKFFHRNSSKKKAVIEAVSFAQALLSKFKFEEITPVFGINSGKVISGIIGTPAVRMDYTVIGDPVNVAARLCQLGVNWNEKIVISGASLKSVKSKYSYERLKVSKVKGKKQEVEVFALKG